jgi:hypothetical protein
MMFSLEQLLFAIANDQRSKEDTIKKILPMMKEVFDMEKKNRNLLKVYTFRILFDNCVSSFILTGIWRKCCGKNS